MMLLKNLFADEGLYKCAIGVKLIMLPMLLVLHIPLVLRLRALLGEVVSDNIEDRIVNQRALEAWGGGIEAREGG